jgi:hypothetical protein
MRRVAVCGVGACRLVELEEYVKLEELECIELKELELVSTTDS